MMRVFPAVIGLMALSACAWTPHEVQVTASAPTEASTIGGGISLALQVIDDRESTVVGQRGAGMQGADITANQVMSILERELTAGFTAKSFRVVPANSPADVEVEARLRAFKFFIETGFFAGAENTSVVVAIEAVRAGRDYDRTYRSSLEKSTLVVPGGSSIDEKLNATFSDVLRKIMSDVELMRFLTDKPGLTAAEVRPSRAREVAAARKNEPTAFDEGTKLSRADISVAHVRIGLDWVASRHGGCGSFSTIGPVKVEPGGPPIQVKSSSNSHDLEFDITTRGSTDDLRLILTRRKGLFGANQVELPVKIGAPATKRTGMKVSNQPGCGEVAAFAELL